MFDSLLEDLFALIIPGAVIYIIYKAVQSFREGKE